MIRFGYDRKNSQINARRFGVAAGHVEMCLFPAFVLPGSWPCISWVVGPDDVTKDNYFVVLVNRVVAVSPMLAKLFR